MPVRRGAVVGVDLVRVRRGDVGARGGDERRLVHPVADPVGPAPKRRAERLEVALDVVEDAEVDEREPPRRASLDLVERPLPGVEVDLGRRRRREHEPARRDADAGRVAVVERPVLVLVRDVVRRRGPGSGSTRARRRRRRRRGRSPRGRARARPRARRTRRRTAGVRSPRAGSGRRGAARRSPRRAPSSAGCSRTSDAGGARVVEVDVREQQVRHVARARRRARASASWSAGRQLVGPQSKRARPSSVSTR